VEEFEKIFSEGKLPSKFDRMYLLTVTIGCVSEMIDLSVRLQNAGYCIRVSKLASRCGESFYEGVSITFSDHLARLKKSGLTN
jgi:hypothetical protein